MAGCAPRLEFDLSCKEEAVGNYFKSSFAKSMALSSENQSKSLDCSFFNASLHSRDPEFVTVRKSEVVSLSKCKRIPMRGGVNGHHGDSLDSRSKATAGRPLASPGSTSSTGSSGGSGSPDADDEISRLRKEVLTLQEENRRLRSGRGVDLALLHTQVDTLQWQLRQTESSRHMYRAVMEQVVRFLERAHRSLRAQTQGLAAHTTNGRVPRSRSVHAVGGAHGGALGTLGGRHGSPVPREVDVHRAKSIAQIEDSQAYSAFRDFTWRRARPQTDTEEVPPEKLSQEAFRLLRTVQSLLGTREPDLAHRIDSGSVASLENPDEQLTSAPASPRKEATDDADCATPRKQPTPQPSLSSAEDESGFSSMGSFQEVGLPMGLPLMNSTQVDWRSRGSFHEVGLPKPPNHRRWSSNPVEALRVLWV